MPSSPVNSNQIHTPAQTPIPAEVPIGLTQAYWENSSRPARVGVFARRAGLPMAGDPSGGFVNLLGAFVPPVIDDLRRGHRRGGTWMPGGPWLAHADAGDSRS